MPSSAQVPGPLIPVADISTTPEDVVTIPLSGKRVCWDGTNADALKSLAGDRWRGVTGGDAFILGAAAKLIRIRPGWVLARLSPGDGVPFLVVAAPEVAALQWRPASRQHG